MNASEFSNLMLAHGVATVDCLSGCTEGEVAEIEQAQSIQLPAFYKDWMRVAGRCAGILRSEESCYPDVLDGKWIAEDLLYGGFRDHGLTLPIDAFVFDRHQDSFWYFNCSCKSDDPQVTYFSVDEDKFETIGTFWDILMCDLRSRLQHMKKFDVTSELAYAEERCRKIKGRQIDGK